MYSHTMVQELLDWLGAVHLGVDAPFDDGEPPSPTSRHHGPIA